MEHITTKEETYERIQQDIYITNLGDTWDSIAFRVYGKEKYMLELIRANIDYVKTIYFPAGVSLICPDIPIPLDDRLPPWKR